MNSHKKEGESGGVKTSLCWYGRAEHSTSLPDHVLAAEVIKRVSLVS